MTDPRITNIATPKVADAPAPLTRGEVALKIITTTQELQSVSRPLRVDGTVTNVSKDGQQATIQTAKGDVTVQLRNNTPLLEGQKIQLDIAAGNPPRQAVARAAPEAQPQQPNGTTPTPTPAQPTSTPPAPQGLAPTPQTGTAPQSPAQAPTTSSPLPPEVRAALDQVAATIPQPVAKQVPAPLPPGAIVRLVPLPGLPPIDQLLAAPLTTITRVTLQATQIAQNALSSGTVDLLHLIPDKASPLPGALPQADTSGKSILSGFVPPQTDGDGFVLKPATDGPPGSFDARLLTLRDHAITAQPASGILTGDVIATTKAQFPILSILLPGLRVAQPFLLQFPATNLPLGSQIEVQPQTLPVPFPTQPASTSTATPAELLTGWNWTVFDDTLETLGYMMPQAHMAQTMTAMLPNPATPAKIPSAIAFFIAAIQSGDLASWMGDKAISALRRDAGRGGDLLSRLTRETDGLARTMDTPVSQDWRGIALPFVWQNELQKIHLFYRKQGGDKENEEDSAAQSTRFLFDLNLDRMGDVQIDGLMKAKRLDVILRTGTLLSHGMQTALRQKYLDVLEAGNLTGDLAFQNRLDQWVRVPIENRPTALKTSV